MLLFGCIVVSEYGYGYGPVTADITIGDPYCNNNTPQRVDCTV